MSRRDSRPRREARDWDCPNCHVMIFGSKSKCFKCHAQRPGVCRPAETPSSSGRVAEARDWDCPSCHKDVFGWRDSCPACRTPRPVTGTDSTQQQAPSSQAAPSQATRRPFDDWDCPACGDKVFGSKLACRCGQRRHANGEEAPPTVEGDWECISCHELNFRTRTECRRCQRPNVERVDLNARRLAANPRRQQSPHDAEGARADSPGTPNPAHSNDQSESESTEGHQNPCVVCLDQPQSVVISVCGHMCLCTECAEAVSNKCPMCRSSFQKEDVIRVFAA